MNSLSTIALPGTLNFYYHEGGRLLARYSFDKPFRVTGDSASLSIPKSERLVLDGSLWVEVVDAHGEVLGNGPASDAVQTDQWRQFATALIERLDAE